MEESAEQPWLTEEIKKEISKRRQLNKLHRNQRNTHQKEEAWKNYTEQKEKVKDMIYIAMRKHEEKIAMEIMEDKDGRRMWENGRKLRGEEKKRGQLKIYSVTGEELQVEEAMSEMERFWEDIYRMKPNKVKKCRRLKFEKSMAKT